MSPTLNVDAGGAAEGVVVSAADGAVDALLDGATAWVVEETSEFAHPRLNRKTHRTVAAAPARDTVRVR
jgi:hypothetical protein